MTFTFHKGKHRAQPLYWLRWFPLLIAPDQISRRVKFSISSKYDLQGDDQADHNKLFGLTYGKVHRNSARFGWRYDLRKNKFILSAYCYLNGERVMEDLCEAVGNHWYDCHIITIGNAYIFRVMNENGDILCTEHINKGHNKDIAWLLGPYFGGNQPAPVEMNIQLKKIRR